MVGLEELRRYIHDQPPIIMIIYVSNMPQFQEDFKVYENYLKLVCL